VSMGGVEHELVELSKEWMEAARSHDRDRLDHLLGKEFSVIGVLGEVDRAEWLENASGPYELDEYAYEELDVDVYGSTAVLCSRYRQTARLGGRDLSGTFLVTDVWVRRDGRWQVVRRHATPAS
jgi:hypothetical protein